MAKKKTKPKPKPKGKAAPAPEPKAPCQLYLITPPKISDIEGFATQLKQAVSAASVACLQIRLKDISDTALIQAASVITPICHAHGTIVLINDRPDLVEPCCADGVHIGQDDMDYLSSRTLLGADAIIGVTCHNSRELAFTAANDGADYVAFGAFYETATKVAKFRAEPEILEWWQDTIEIPCVAIGGIVPENAQSLVEAGADFLAVSSGVWNHPQGPAAAVKAFHALFYSQPH